MKLDDAFANAAYIPDGMHYPDRWAEQAARFREGALEQGLADLDIFYGGSPRQCFDLFQPVQPAKGLLIFVHGGYWLRFDKSFFSHLAGGALGTGWAVAMPSYDLCPDVRIADITAQITRAVEAAAVMVAGPIALAGHSAGGHLVARMAEAGRLSAQTAARLTHIMPISPVADLRPLLETSMNADFKLDLASAAAESPVLMTNRIACPVTAWVGGAERPVFLQQAHALAETWSCDEVITPEEHHFNVIEPLADPESEMVRRLLT